MINEGGKWKGISVEMDAVATTVEEKTNTWNKSCRESENRESELYKMVQKASIDEKARARAISMKPTPELETAETGPRARGIHVLV